MDKIEKVLNKLSEKEKALVKILLERLRSGKTTGLNIQQLRGFPGIFRIRKGAIRIIFRTHEGGTYLLKIDRRSEDTYRDF